MSVSLRQLRAFVMIADCKSFTKAGDELFLTQSSLSGLIKEMEKQLDVKLFDRTTRQIHLSDAGERLLPHARRILDEVRLFDHETHDLKDFHQGKIRLAVSQQLAASGMPRLIQKFRTAYPSVQVTLLDCSIEEVISRVQSLDADIGIGPERTLGSDILADELFESPFHAVLPATHVLADRPHIAWGELEHEHVITLRGNFTQRLMDELPKELSSRLFRADYEVNFLSTALGMAQMGLGLTITLPHAKNWVDQHGLVMRPLVEPSIHRKFMCYTHKRRSPTSAMSAFLRFLKGYAKAWK
ncbi:LysR family transcriptional regulator [Moraxella lacunata]|uniref:LysR family transcriptional regulator n=1 Tax=Moraxella lacunata TaxID=477 RepID=A0A1V4GSJ1_MORLA|nr:LysR family transcriptional regulator [Moraxella lacunata]OPH35582.1 LysR family transcriptional regulator [Moraxella lacunata]